MSADLGGQIAFDAMGPEVKFQLFSIFEASRAERVVFVRPSVRPNTNVQTYSPLKGGIFY